MRGKTNSKRFPKHHSHRQRPKTHSRKMLFSTKTFSTINETRPDMMASCSFPENTKNNDLYLVRRRDLVKTNLITSASCLDTNSRVKCSMHSSPNIVTAHRVYPYTFIYALRHPAEKQSKRRTGQGPTRTTTTRICHGHSGEKPLCRYSQKDAQTN